MKKIIKKWGDSLVVVFNKEDCKIHGMVEGSVVDLSDVTVLNESAVKYNSELADLNISKICKDMKDDGIGNLF